MTGIAEAILAEKEQEMNLPAAAERTFTAPKSTTLDSSKEILDKGMAKHPKSCLAFSGGSDSLVLLDLVAKASYRPIIIWVDTQMEYPESRSFIEKIVAKYGLDLRITKARRTPLEQWQHTGWPILGKMAARLWMQQNRGMGFALNVSECCRTIKIEPARILARNLGCGIQLTGQRGKIDDNLRGFRSMKDGDIFFHKRDRIWIVNPLIGWTDVDVRNYIEKHGLEEHPARAKGAKTIGCVYCGGGSQYTNSGYRVLRKTWPEAWRQFIVEWRGGLVILAVKYKKHIEDIRTAVNELGGLEALAIKKPWVFDFTRKTPHQGYEK